MRIEGTSDDRHTKGRLAEFVYRPPIPTWDHGFSQYLSHRVDHGCDLSFPGGCPKFWRNRMDNDRCVLCSRYHCRFHPSTFRVLTVYDANPRTTFTSTGATLIGKLNSFDGSDAPTVTVYYGLIDQNQSDTGWDGSAVVGTVQAGADFSKAVSGLQQGKKILLSCQGSQCCR